MLLQRPSFQLLGLVTTFCRLLCLALLNTIQLNCILHVSCRLKLTQASHYDDLIYILCGGLEDCGNSLHLEKIFWLCQCR